VRVVKPRPVKLGDNVGLVATSSPVTSNQLDTIVRYFERAGYGVKLGDHVKASTGYLAGSAADRCSDLEMMFMDSSVSLIVPVNGGKGANHLIDRLDYNVIRSNPKVFTGVSDPAVVCNALYSSAGLSALHGPSGVDFFQPKIDDFTEEYFWRLVTGDVSGLSVPGSDWRFHANGSEVTQVAGTVVGGHIGSIQALVGTQWMPSLRGAILFLEEVAVPWVRIDAMLTNFRLAGVFDEVAGVVFGVPVECDKGEAPDDSLDDLLLRCLPENVPVITNVPFGHTPEKIPVPIGARVEFDVSGSPSMSYLESFVQV
jgi:muramoyltetrapeptide carboxypeptidase